MDISDKTLSAVEKRKLKRQQETPNCHQWTQEDRDWRKDAGKDGNKWVRSEKSMCERHGYFYTKGNNEDYPGCGRCHCCKVRQERGDDSPNIRPDSPRNKKTRIRKSDLYPDCYTITKKDKEWQRQGGKTGRRFTRTEKDMCENAGHIFTDGDNRNFPECGVCKCCIQRKKVLEKKDELGDSSSSDESIIVARKYSPSRLHLDLSSTSEEELSDVKKPIRIIKSNRLEKRRFELKKLEKKIEEKKRIKSRLNRKILRKRIILKNLEATIKHLTTNDNSYDEDLNYQHTDPFGDNDPFGENETFYRETTTKPKISSAIIPYKKFNYEDYFRPEDSLKTTSYSDSGRLSDSGRISDSVSESDSGRISDLGRISDSVSESDSGRISDSGRLSDSERISDSGRLSDSSSKSLINLEDFSSESSSDESN